MYTALPFLQALIPPLAVLEGEHLGSLSNALDAPSLIPATAKNSVLIGPGQTAVTLIFLFFNSYLSEREKLITNDFVAEYTLILAFGTKEAIEQVFIM